MVFSVFPSTYNINGLATNKPKSANTDFLKSINSLSSSKKQYGFSVSLFFGHGIKFILSNFHPTLVKFLNIDRMFIEMFIYYHKVWKVFGLVSYQ